MALVLLDTFAGSGSVIDHTPDVAPVGTTIDSTYPNQVLTISGGNARVPPTYNKFGPPGRSAATYNIPDTAFIEELGTISFEAVMHADATSTGDNALFFEHPLLTLFMEFTRPIFDTTVYQLSAFSPGNSHNEYFPMPDLSEPVILKVHTELYLLPGPPDDPEFYAYAGTTRFYVNGEVKYTDSNEFYRPFGPVQGYPFSLNVGVNETYFPDSTSSVSSVSLDLIPGSPLSPPDFWTSEILCQES